MNFQFIQNNEQLVKYRQDLVNISKNLKLAATKFHSQSIQRYKFEVIIFIIFIKKYFLQKNIAQFKQQLELAEERMKELVSAKNDYEELIAEMDKN